MSIKINRNKILICLFRFPYPVNDGTKYKIFYNLISGLARDFDLEFLILTDEEIKKERIDFLENNFGKVYIYKHSKYICAFNSLRALSTGRPFQTEYFYFKSAATFLKNKISDYDAVYVHTIRLGAYFEHITHDYVKKVFFDFNDAISLNYREAKKYASFWWRLIFLLEEKRIRIYESSVLKKFKFFNVVSDFDRQYLLHNLTTDGFKNIDVVFSCIKHGIDEKIFTYSWNPKNKDIVFMGNLFYPPNYDAVLFFIKNIWPNILLQNPESHFVVIGKKHPSLPNAINVTYTGFVEDPYELISHSKVFVAPIRFGGGVPTKILEAMAIGLPIVTTNIAVRGIENTHTISNVYIFDSFDIKGMSSAIINLQNNSNIDSQSSKNESDFIKKYYTLDKAQEGFREMFIKIIS